MIGRNRGAAHRCNLLYRRAAMLASLIKQDNHPRAATVGGAGVRRDSSGEGDKLQPELERLYVVVAKWMNDNQGVVSALIFAVTLLFGWLSGIFAALRRKPKLRIRLIEGPTFCCTFETGREHNAHPVHRTGIALYLRVANLGSAATTIEEVAVGYHWSLLRSSWKQRLRYGLGWFWLEKQAASLRDFQVDMGNGDTKVFPFLVQVNFLLPNHSPRTYLEPGESTSGVVYFEQTDSWGACFPRVDHGRVRIRVRVTDTALKAHTATFWIPSVSLEQARRFNPAFGTTHATLRGEPLPHDRPNPASAAPSSGDTAPAPAPPP